MNNNLINTFDIKYNIENVKYNIQTISYMPAVVNYPYINALIELLNTNPKYFKGGYANNLLYITNMGTNYKAEILYNSLTSFLKQTSKDIISYPIAQAYFFAIDNTYNILEPSMKLVKDAMDYFLNSEQIINLENDGEITKHYYSDLKHLFWSKQGINFEKLVIPFSFYLTYLIYGNPYMFYDEIGAESALRNLLIDVDDYFKAIINQIFNENNLSTSNIYDSLISLPENVLTKIIQKVLSTETIIKLRNIVLNKTKELYTENYSSQKSITQEYMNEKFQIVLDQVVKLSINNNGFEQHLSKLESRDNIDCIFPQYNFNYNELFAMTEYYLTGCDTIFKLDDDYNYISSNYKYSKPVIKSKLGSLFIQTPFVNSNIMLKTFISYLRNQISYIQSEFLSDMSDVNISVNSSDFDNNYYKSFLKLFTNSVWFNYNDTVEWFWSNIPQIKFIINDLMLLHTKTSKIKAMSLSIYYISLLDKYISDITTNKDSINFMTYVLNYPFDSKRYNKIEGMLIGLVFCKNKDYTNYISETLSKFNTKVSKSELYLLYVNGNNDLSNVYSIGGIELYNQMTNNNPLYRGYHFIKNTLGTTVELERFYNKIKNFNDQSLIDLINNSDNNNTIYDILKLYDSSHKEIYIVLDDYTISNYKFTPKESWYNLTINNDNVYNYLLKYSFKPILNDFTYDTIRSKHIKKSDDRITLDVSEPERISELVYKNKYIPLNINSNLKYVSLPILKYIGEWNKVGLEFSPPAHYELYDLRGSNMEKNMCLLMLSNTEVIQKN